MYQILQKINIISINLFVIFLECNQWIPINADDFAYYLKIDNVLEKDFNIQLKKIMKFDICLN